MAERLLTTKEAASFLGVSPAFLERDRWANVVVPYVRVGSRTVRYQLTELEAYVNSNRRRPARPHVGTV